METLNIPLGALAALTLASGAYTVANLKRATAPNFSYRQFLFWVLSILAARRLAGWWVPFGRAHRERFERDPRKKIYKKYKSPIDNVAIVLITAFAYFAVWAWYANVGEYITFASVNWLTIGLACLCFAVMVRTLLKASRDLRAAKIKENAILGEDDVSTLRQLGARTRSHHWESARAPAARETHMEQKKVALERERNELLLEAEIASGLAASYKKTIDTKEKEDALLAKRKAELDRVWGED